MATAAVCVRPGMLPATIMVAPKSPRERANASTVAASTERRASGRLTRQNTRHSDAPRLRAALS